MLYKVKSIEIHQETEQLVIVSQISIDYILILSLTVIIYKFAPRFGVHFFVLAFSFSPKSDSAQHHIQSIR